jgi:3-phenylpropionate/cinnamic acid dioxygenase small subunit
MDSNDRIALHELMSRYAYALDEHLMDGLSECFGETARFTIAIKGHDDVREFDGKEAIMELFREAAAAQSNRRRHVITNVFVNTRAEGEADVFSNLTLFSISDGSLIPLTCGVYRDLVRCVNGRWQIASRELSLDLPY